jgi:hypothetical protein
MIPSRICGALMLLVAGSVMAGAACAETVLKVDLADNRTTRYVDGGAAGGQAAQNSGRIVRIEQWQCPSGAWRPANGAVHLCVPKPLYAGYDGGYSENDCDYRTVRLEPRQCIPTATGSSAGYVFDYPTYRHDGITVTNMLRVDNGAYFVAVGKAGDRVEPAGGNAGAAAAAAALVGAAAAGYYNACSGTAFNLLSDPVPNARRNPGEYACFQGYASHAR